MTKSAINKKQNTKQKKKNGPVGGRPKPTKVMPAQRGGGGQPSGNLVSTNTRTGKRVPQTMMVNGSTIVSHTETYGVNIVGTDTFEVKADWALQPGITGYSRGIPLGSWLPQIAGNFDNYEIQSLRFSYRAACSTLEPGLVMFAYEPNPEGNVPSSYQELRNMMSVDGSAHANLTFDVTTKARKVLLTRKGLVVNLPSYDAGKVYFATIGCTDGAKLGFVDVHYKIRLMNPQSSLSTTIPTITYEPLRPKWRIEATPNGATYNLATSCMTLSYNNAFGAESGAVDLVDKVTANVTNFDFTIANGCKFTQAGGTAVAQLKVNFAGRYRLRAQFCYDFQDLQLFAAVPVYQRNSFGPAYRVAVEQVYGSATGSSVTELNCIPMVHRGFTGTAVGDPNPATDLGILGVWDIALQAGDYFGVAVGVRTYNNVSTTTANAIFIAGLGPSYYELEFLGP